MSTNTNLAETVKKLSAVSKIKIDQCRDATDADKLNEWLKLHTYIF